MKFLIPPLLLLWCIIGMITLHFWYPGHQLLPPPFTFLGLLPLAAGFYCVGWTSKTFASVETPINTFHTPQKLVTSGLFRRSRNPIYFGLVLMLTGVWFLLGSCSSGSILVFFILVLNFWYIPVEEKNLLAQFGKEYEEYRKRVRRWV